VPLTSSPRRALGLLAAGTIGLSTALLGVAGVASAEPGDAVATEVAAALSVPAAPEELEVDRVGDGSVTVSFLTFYDPDEEAETTGYEYSIDNGGSWKPLTVTAPYGNNERVGTVSGLTNKTTYTVMVHATSAVGASGDSNTVHATPAKPIGAPVGLTVTTSPGKVTATWSAPTVAGSYAVDGYDVGIFQAGPNGEGGMGGQLCETTADVLTCTGDAEYGTEWQVAVTAIDEEGNPGVTSAPVVTGKIPYPATVPTSNGPLTPAAGSSDKVVAGKTMVVSGTGYEPLSTVTILIYSQPQVLTTVVADASGNFTVTVTVPAGLAPGQHTLVASGYDANGDQRFTTLVVTVSAGGTATVTGPKLANTGADVTVPALGGIATLGLGAGLIALSRRRRTAA
jgi:LPXTG-motif cell wall-anchored protein